MGHGGALKRWFSFRTLYEILAANDEYAGRGYQLMIH